MVIMHVARIVENLCNGVCVAVPQHIIAQQNFADIGFINITNYKPEGIKHQFIFEKHMKLSALPSPFSRPDLVVFHEVYIPEFIRLARDLRKNGIPYIIIPHGSLTKEAQEKSKAKKIIANMLVFNRFIDGAKAIQCLSNREEENTIFGNKKIIYPNGINLPFNSKKIFNSNIVDILFIGRLEIHIKGLDILIDSVSTSIDRFSEERCMLSIYGRDIFGFHDELKKIITEKGVNSFVNLNHEIIGKDKEKRLLSSDIFIQTSRSEGLPMGILEALSYGIPCIVTKGTGIGDLIQLYDAGWVAETESKSVSEALVKALVERNTWPEKSNNAIRLIRDNFLWDAVAERTIKSYDNL